MYVGNEWVGGLEQGLEEWGGVMPVSVVSLDYLCKWQVQVSVYCARRIPAHLRNTQCSILFHLIDICFIPYIANPDLFVCSCRTPICLDNTRFYEEQCQASSRYAWPACPKTVNRAAGFDTICTAVCNRRDSSTACRLCRLEPTLRFITRI